LQWNNKNQKYSVLHAKDPLKLSSLGTILLPHCIKVVLSVGILDTFSLAHIMIGVSTKQFLNYAN